MRVVNCILYEHNVWLVLLAALVCALGAEVTLRLFYRARNSHGEAHVAWTFLGAVAAGSTIWCTHFVAMLAYTPGVPITYEPALTGTSLAVAVVACGIAFAIASARVPAAPLFGGAVYGGGIAAMHFTGMAAFMTEAVVTWSPAYVAVSVLFAVCIGALAFGRAARAATHWQRYAATGLVVAAIVTLHFTAMAAIDIQPFLPLDGSLTMSDANQALATSVAGVGLLVLGTGAVSYLLDLRTQEEASAKLRHLTESAVDGMIVEQDGRILQINAALEEMAGRPRSEILGTPFADHFDKGIDVVEGELVKTTLYTGNGEEIPVEVVVHSEQIKPREAKVVVYAVRDRRPRLAQERRIAFLASNDSLTRLPNRAFFLERLDASLTGLEADRKIALLTLDMNRFKEINDLFGHGAGDHLLRHFAERVQNVLRDDELVARYGGDEFAAYKTVRDADEAQEFARRLTATLHTPVRYEHNDLRSGASVGIALYPDDANDANMLLNNADLAMYRAKVSPPDHICFYERMMDDSVRERRHMVEDLRNALVNEQFELRYQVQVSARTEEVTGYEALLRWKHPERGYVPPAEFIPLAEQTGLIIDIGEWVLRTACAHAVRWKEPHKIAVNLSAVQLCTIELPRIIHRILLETGLSPQRLECEVTETALIVDRERASHVLRQIKALGVTIAMDDFGTGYSSLSTLQNFAFDKIKLDRSFMQELGRSHEARAIMQAVLALGESLQIPVLAEGVETAEQFALLRSQGCDEVQGYYFGHPLPEIAPPCHRAAADTVRRIA